MTTPRKARWGIAALVTAALITLGIILAAHFKLIHFRGQWMYRSIARVKFEPVVPPADPATCYPGFNEYVRSQKTIILSHRQIALTLQEPAWRATGKGNSDAVLQEFSCKLTVEQSGGLVTITYLDEKEDVSLAAVQSAFSAYRKLDSCGEPFTESQLKQVTALRDKLRMELANLQAQYGDLTKLPFLAEERIDREIELNNESFVLGIWPEAFYRLTTSRYGDHMPLAPYDKLLLADLHSQAFTHLVDILQETPPAEPAEIQDGVTNVTRLDHQLMLLSNPGTSPPLKSPPPYHLYVQPDAPDPLWWTFMTGAPPMPPIAPYRMIEKADELERNIERLDAAIEQLNKEMLLENRTLFLSDGEKAGRVFIE